MTPSIRVATFDVYGTLIDWEGGAASFLYELASRHEPAPPPARELRERWEALQFERLQGDWRRYSEVLSDSLSEWAAERGYRWNEHDGEALVRSMKSWQPFPDTIPSLREAKEAGIELWLISNTDRAIIEHTLRHLEVPFDGVVVAEDCRAYKPSHKPFEHALRRDRRATGRDLARGVRLQVRHRARQAARPAHRLGEPPRRGGARPGGARPRVARPAPARLGRTTSPAGSPRPAPAPRRRRRSCSGKQATWKPLAGSSPRSHEALDLRVGQIGLVRRPEDARLVGLERLLRLDVQRPVPAPGVDPHHAHAALVQPAGGAGRDARAERQVLGRLDEGVAARAHEHDVARRELVADAARAPARRRRSRRPRRPPSPSCRGRRPAPKNQSSGSSSMVCARSPRMREL